MKKKFLYLFSIMVLVTVFIYSCKRKDINQDDEHIEAITPVTITTISNETMKEYIELNATSIFLQKWMIRANATGYLQSANIVLNQYIQKGQVLYSIKTKEAQSIGNSISILDSALKFSGINIIKADESGFISQINHQSGEYVQDGEQLAVITDTKSFVFLLDMPYELRPYIINKKSLELILPDGEKLIGIISGNMPTMDVGSQTQSIILKINPSHPLPENLIAKVQVVKSERNNTFSLPKAAVLTDETQSEFWVMKMIDASTAVKVPIKKGIETMDRVEILSPVFSMSDKILITGNYGLSDTSKVQIIQP